MVGNAVTAAPTQTIIFCQDRRHWPGPSVPGTNAMSLSANDNDETGGSATARLAVSTQCRPSGIWSPLLLISSPGLAVERILTCLCSLCCDPGHCQSGKFGLSVVWNRKQRSLIAFLSHSAASKVALILAVELWCKNDRF